MQILFGNGPDWRIGSHRDPCRGRPDLETSRRVLIFTQYVPSDSTEILYYRLSKYNRSYIKQSPYAIVFPAWQQVAA